MNRARPGQPRRKPHKNTSHGWVAILGKAIDAHRAEQWDAAELLYRRVLHMQAGQPDALHFLGVLCHQSQRSEEAVRLIRMALRSAPQHADAHNNLGNIHKETGNLAEAEACYRSALACNAQQHDALSNLALVLEAQERPDEALQVYVALVAQAPQLERSHYLMGMYLRRHLHCVEDVEQAVVCFRNAIQCDGQSVRSRDALGVALYRLDRRDEAIAFYRDWLDREPANPVPRHMLAACGGAVAPSRADDDYVRSEFDRFAESFDEQLLTNLEYRAPQILTDALIDRLGAPEAALDILDAGCGTGLCGPLIRSHARLLSGVDLSGGMIEKAASRGGYDELVVVELTAYLQAHPGIWDVVLSADTLIYFGDLQTVLSAAFAALRPGGWIAFTVEAMDGDEPLAWLTSSGRFRHTRRYVEQALDASGFGDVAIATEVLRRELGEPVTGLVVLARKGVD